MPNFELEEEVRRRAENPDLVVVGIDEVGVGCLAGPVVAAAVVLAPNSPWLNELDDSKKLSQKKRQRLHEIIMAEAIAVGVGWATNKEVDDVGISSARRRAVLKAFRECCSILGESIAVAAVVDDRRLGWLRADLGGRPSIFSDKADTKSYSVAAASIVAKVIRDTYMIIQASKFPRYGWINNKGYGAPEHLKAIEQYGPCQLHRKTFNKVKEFTNNI